MTQDAPSCRARDPGAPQPSAQEFGVRNEVNGIAGGDWRVAWAQVDKTIGPGERTQHPGTVRSSPVARTAALSRRYTTSRARPTDAAMATSCGRSLSPANRTAAPALTSSPVSRMFAPAGRPRTVTTVPSRTAQSSCMATVSAHEGTAAPVRMRIALPPGGMPPRTDGLPHCGRRCAGGYHGRRLRGKRIRPPPSSGKAEWAPLTIRLRPAPGWPRPRCRLPRSTAGPSAGPGCHSGHPRGAGDAPRQGHTRARWRGRWGASLAGRYEAVGVRLLVRPAPPHESEKPPQLSPRAASESLYSCERSTL